MRVRSVGLAARRVRQTLTAFDNGPAILLALARRSPELRLRTRTGLDLVVPNVPGARFPVYETHADDIYGIDELLSGTGPAPVVVDIGAHVGGFATAVCRTAPNARVHAYEASPSTAAWLAKNVARNGLEDRVVVHNVAVSDHEGSLSIVDNGLASAHNGLTAPVGAGATIEVPCVPFARVLETAGGRIDVVKIDAEGAEYGITIGGSPELWASVQRVVMEYHPVDGHGFDDLVRFFDDAGLILARRDPITDRLGTAWFQRP